MATVTLSKGNEVNLSKAAPELKEAFCGLGWDMNEGVGTYDLDIFAVNCGADGKAIEGDDALVFYNHQANVNGSVKVSEDNLTGEGDGYDEHIIVKLPEVPENVSSIVVGVSIFNAEQKGQHFGEVKNAFCDVLNNENEEKIAGYDLTADMGENTAIIAGKFDREGDGWKFTAVGDGFKGGMPEVLAKFGIQAA